MFATTCCADSFRTAHLNTLVVRTGGENHVPVLQAPPQQHLPGGFPHLLGNPLYRLVLQEQGKM